MGPQLMHVRTRETSSEREKVNPLLYFTPSPEPHPLMQPDQNTYSGLTLVLVFPEFSQVWRIASEKGEGKSAGQRRWIDVEQSIAEHWDTSHRSGLVTRDFSLATFFTASSSSSPSLSNWVLRSSGLETSSLALVSLGSSAMPTTAHVYRRRHHHPPPQRDTTSAALAVSMRSPSSTLLVQRTPPDAASTSPVRSRNVVQRGDNPVVSAPHVARSAILKEKSSTTLPQPQSKPAPGAVFFFEANSQEVQRDTASMISFEGYSTREAYQRTAAETDGSHWFRRAGSPVERRSVDLRVFHEASNARSRSRQGPQAVVSVSLDD